MKKFFVMLALAWGTVGAFAQNEADSVAAVFSIAEHHPSPVQISCHICLIILNKQSVM